MRLSPRKNGLTSLTKEVRVFKVTENRRGKGVSPRRWRGRLPRASQRALRDILMPRGKNWLPTVSRQFLTRSYARPNCLLRCLPNCLSPTREGLVPNLPFLAFLENSKENHQKKRISSACRTPETLGKEGKNAQNRKGILEKEKGKENQKGKEKKLRVYPHSKLPPRWG